MNIFPLLASLIIFANTDTNLLAKNKTEVNPEGFGVKIESSVNSEVEIEDEEMEEKDDHLSVRTKSDSSAHNSVQINKGKFEIKGFFVNPNTTLTPTPTSSVNTTLSANAKVNINAHDPIDQVIAFLHQVLSFLQTLV